MKKLLALLLCFVLIITTFSFNLVNAATITDYSEDFESYDSGDSLTSGSDTAWAYYDEGEGGYWKTQNVGSRGWFYNNNGNLKVETTTVNETQTKALFIPGWVTAVKEIEVRPNTDYSLSFNFITDMRKNIDISVLDATGVNGYSFKAYTAFTPISTANKVKAYDNTLLPELSHSRSVYTANTLQTQNLSFSTGANTTKIVFVFATEDSTATYLDNIVLSYEFYPEVTVTTTGIEGEKGGEASAKLTENDTKITYEAHPYDTAEFLGWYKNGVLYNENPIFTENYNPDSYVILEAKFNATAVNLFPDDSLKNQMQALNIQVLQNITG